MSRAKNERRWPPGRWRPKTGGTEFLACLQEDARALRPMQARRRRPPDRPRSSCATRKIATQYRPLRERRGKPPGLSGSRTWNFLQMAKAHRPQGMQPDKDQKSASGDHGGCPRCQQTAKQAGTRRPANTRPATASPQVWQRTQAVKPVLPRFLPPSRDSLPESPGQDPVPGGPCNGIRRHSCSCALPFAGNSPGFGSRRPTRESPEDRTSRKQSPGAAPSAIPLAHGHQA